MSCGIECRRMLLGIVGMIWLTCLQNARMGQDQKLSQA